MTAAEPAQKHHLLSDPAGIPLAISLTGGNRNDVIQLLPLVDGLGPVKGRVGRPRLRAAEPIADRGYDHDKYRRALWARGVKPTIARRSTEPRVGPRGAALGRRAHLRLAALLPAPETPLGATPGAPPRLHAPRLCGDLPALPAGVVKQVLRRRGMALRAGSGLGCSSGSPRLLACQPPRRRLAAPRADGNDGRSSPHSPDLGRTPGGPRKR